MLDHVQILHTGGLVLWSRSYTPAVSPVNSLVKEALIEERADGQAWEKDGYSVQWTRANDLGLIFVVAYQRILQLTYTNDLLDTIKRVFIQLYEPILRLIIETATGLTPATQLASAEALKVFHGNAVEGWKSCFTGWDETFNKLLRTIETTNSRSKKQQVMAKTSKLDQAAEVGAADESQTPTVAMTTATDSEVIARNIAALQGRRRKAAGRPKGSRAGTDSESEVSRPGTPSSRPVKEARKWDNGKITAKDMEAFDFSIDKPGEERDVSGLVDQKAMGKRSKGGLYEVADYGRTDDGDEIKAAPGWFSRLAATVGLDSSAVLLTPAELKPVLSAMKEHLMRKNVACEIADKICESVGKSLEGKTVKGYKGVKTAVKDALNQSLTKILTPKTSTDVLLDIQRKRVAKSSLLPSLASTDDAGTTAADPYAIAFVGVNGVGKSTNLSKVAFWLLQNRLRVLIAACDTFRSGAVEQLRVHVRNLSKLGDEDLEHGHAGEGGKGGGNRVELFERGYGKDAAGIAKDAIAHAKANKFDVVLIDTAGRMQDNEPLMRALAKLVAVNRPDKIVFVGEALVGNEAVDQLTRFDRSLRDFSGASAATARGIDGMILTKFDTIDDKVGAALSMTYVTGQPILFVGTGQTYTDLKALRVAHIVAALLQE